MTAGMPMFTVWFATGNNLTFRGDILRRVLPCRLQSPEERPEERGNFTVEGDLLEHVRRERPRLVVDALTLLRAHALAGRPADGLKPIGSFESWSQVMRAAVHWATEVDPCATREDLRANDPDTAVREAIVGGWAELPRSDKGLTVAAAIRLLQGDHQHYGTLRDALLGLSHTSDLPSAKAIGVRLKALRDRVIGGRRLRSKSLQNTHHWRVETIHHIPDGTDDSRGLQNTHHWRVETITPEDPCGSGGSGGSDSIPHAEKWSDSCSGIIRERNGEDSHQTHHSHIDGRGVADETSADTTGNADVEVRWEL